MAAAAATSDLAEADHGVMRLMRLVGAAGIGYGLGTIPFADLAAKRASDGRIDLREWGSRNPGAMNAMRTFGPRTGIAVALADAAKGVVACAVGKGLAADAGGHVAGVSAVVGHCYPPGRRGGKGVATSAGQLVATFPAFAPLEAVVGIGTGALVSPGRPGRRALVTTVVASAAWVAGGVVWWRKRLPNAWGVEPTGALPLASAASSAIVMARFWDSIRRGQPDDYAPEA